MSKGVEITNSLYSELWQISPLTFELGLGKLVHSRAICHKNKIDSGHRHDQAAIRCDSLYHVVLNQKTERSALVVRFVHKKTRILAYRPSCLLSIID